MVWSIYTSNIQYTVYIQGIPALMSEKHQGYPALRDKQKRSHRMFHLGLFLPLLLAMKSWNIPKTAPSEEKVYETFFVPLVELKKTMRPWFFSVWHYYWDILHNWHSTQLCMYCLALNIKHTYIHASENFTIRSGFWKLQFSPTTIWPTSRPIRGSNWVREVCSRDKRSSRIAEGQQTRFGNLPPRRWRKL